MKLLSGNEAIALSAHMHGVHVASGYPGTPSTEILENLANYNSAYCEWAPNEKVALEVAVGASMGGARAIFTCKHVGLNVAADPLLTACNTGVNGGLVLIVADDPSMYSSQNEQDTRNYAAFARIPCLEPSNSQEAFWMLGAALEISEKFDTPVILRETMRIAHTKTLVDDGGCTRQEVPLKDFEDNPKKYIMMPVNAKPARLRVDAREISLQEFSNNSQYNRVEYSDKTTGIICNGASYMHVKEALPHASVLKIGFSWPIPAKLIKEFAKNVDKLYVVEEACDFLDLRVRALGLVPQIPPASVLPKAGELSPKIIAKSFDMSYKDEQTDDAIISVLPPRPPTLCPGCPHRLMFYELHRLKAIVTGDIGCYTLGAVVPLSAMHSTLDMGASISMAHGLQLANTPERENRPVVAVIGDSTFAHSGITSLLDMTYNKSKGTICILDNRVTAMTGLQGNPCNGIRLSENIAPKSYLETVEHRDASDEDFQLNIEKLCKTIGVQNVTVVDSQNHDQVKKALKMATSSTDTLDVIVFKSPCQLIRRKKLAPPKVENCRACGLCLKLGCSAINKGEDGAIFIDTSLCIGCGQCEQICAFGAIKQ